MRGIAVEKNPHRREWVEVIGGYSLCGNMIVPDMRLK